MLVQAIADPTLGLLQFPGFNAEGIKQLRQKRVGMLVIPFINPPALY